MNVVHNQIPVREYRSVEKKNATTLRIPLGMRPAMKDGGTQITRMTQIFTDNRLNGKPHIANYQQYKNPRKSVLSVSSVFKLIFNIYLWKKIQKFTSPATWAW